MLASLFRFGKHFQSQVKRRIGSGQSAIQCGLQKHLLNLTRRHSHIQRSARVGRNVWGMDLPGIDIVKIAQGYGMAAQEVDQPVDLEPALRQAFASAEPRLISVNVAAGSQ